MALVKNVYIVFTFVALAAWGQQENDPERARRMAELVNRPVVYKVPGMDQVSVKKDLTYKKIDDPNVKMDVYTPPGLAAGEKRPAVVFIHGGAASQFRPKDWGVYQSWGRLTAASGMAAVIFTHRLGFPQTAILDGASDVADALSYIRANADSLGIDKDRLCLAAYSAGGPMLSPFMSDPPPYVRCLVGFYPFLDIRQTKEHQASETAETLQKFSPIVQVGTRPERVPPLFVARAGKDEIPTLLDSVDRFAAEALKRNVPVTVMNHPSGSHGFDNQVDDERSREIVRGAVEFMKLQLGIGGTGNAPTGSREEQEKALVELERRRSYAIWEKNIEPLESIYADDFRGLVADGSFLDKTGVFEMFKGHDPSIRFSIEELEARVLGQSAVTHGRITGRDPKGEIVILSKFTHVYVWRDGRWQIVEGVSLPLRRG